jgi:hypothetical protein
MGLRQTLAVQTQMTERGAALIVVPHDALQKPAMQESVPQRQKQKHKQEV